MNWIMSFTVSTPREGAPPLVEVGNAVTTEHPLLAVVRWNRRREPTSTPPPAQTLLRPGSKVVLNWYAPLTHAEQTALFGTGLVTPTESAMVVPVCS